MSYALILHVYNVCWTFACGHGWACMLFVTFAALELDRLRAATRAPSR